MPGVLEFRHHNLSSSKAVVVTIVNQEMVWKLAKFLQSL
jgi:hypothetical protein